ncbi:MAG: hypothetical protein ACRDWF_02145 [Acidimicrobiia bacterium]|jgi:hypothetical protein
MIRLAAVLLFAVEVGSGFGVASASVVSMTEESMIIEIRVEVETSADSVVVHLALPDEDPITLPMLERDDGAYGVTTEVKPANYIVMFEAIGDPGAESDQVSLTDLGVDLSSTSGTTTTTESEEVSAGTQQWLWLGVALGAASLSALAFWVLGGRDRDEASDEPEEEAQADQPEAAPPEEEPSHVP